MHIDANQRESQEIALDPRPRIRTYMREKLGRCPYCIRWTGLGMLFGWIAVAGAALAHAPIAFTVTLAAAAAAVTALYALHITTFTSRVLRGPELPVNVARRQFLVKSVQVGTVALAAAVAEPVLRGVAFATGRETNPGNNFCAKLCQILFPPGPERGRCIADGARGQGICFSGTCLPAPPASSQFKPKQTQEAKIQALLAGNPTSSTLAGNFFHTVRRFLQNAAPANDLENTMFPAFAALPETTKQVLTCAVNRFDALSRDDRVTLFGEPFAEPVLPPISPDDLSRSLARELQQILLADSSAPPLCLVETPGLIRPITYVVVIEGGGSITQPAPWIDRIDTRRTKAFLKEGGGYLALAEYTEDEIEQACHPDPQPPGIFCEVHAPPCPADGAVDPLSPPYQVDGACLRVSTVVAGSSIRLEGLNFYDVNARVVLYNAVTSREVEATVCGDTETPLTDAMGTVIADSRVRDVIGFTVPADLPDGIYEVAVIVANPMDALEYRTPTGYTTFIRVLAPFTGRFQITTDTLRCNTETGLTSFGSDEVGIRILSAPIRLGAGQVEPEVVRRDFRFSDVDSGETREMIAQDGSRILIDLEPSADLIGVIVTIAGFEVDNERAYEQQIDDIWELFVRFLLAEIAFLTALLGPLVLWYGLGPALGLVVAHPIIAGIAVAIALAIPLFIALWAPADPIIEDAIGLTVADLLEMTSQAFPVPNGPPYSSPVTYSHGITAEVISVEKAPGQLREQRRYEAPDEDSAYTIGLRYGRAPALAPTTRSVMAGAVKDNSGATLDVEKRAFDAAYMFHWQAPDSHAGEPKSIRIYDVAGRERARLNLGVEAAGTAVWDRCDGRGAPLPSGVYFGVLSGPNTWARTRIVLLR